MDNTTTGSAVSSFLNGFQLTGDINWATLIVTIILAFVLGVVIFLIYKKTFQGVIYVKTFGISLIMLCMVTSTIIMTISSNLMLSLGMVGALSIVRFRTAVKDPMDTVYMFWAIGEGISVGAKLYMVAIITTVIISVVVVIISMVRTKKDMPYIMVIRFDESARQEVQKFLAKLPEAKLKSKTVSRGIIELTMEIGLKENELGAVERIADIQGVYDASIVSYSGDAIA